jgi:hypothetical protein
VGDHRQVRNEQDEALEALLGWLYTVARAYDEDKDEAWHHLNRGYAEFKFLGDNLGKKGMRRLYRLN